MVAWGGDGTVNEVATALVGTAAALAIVPAGSGNGLARMLGMPADASRALGRILHGADRLIDVGDIDGRLFVNVAGVGFDAHIAGAFAAIGRARRGFLRYGLIVARELRQYTAACSRWPSTPATARRADQHAPRVSPDVCQRPPVGQWRPHRATG